MSSFCEKKKKTFAISLHFSPFWQMQPFGLSDVLHKENYSLSMFIYNYFDAVDFSERRSEEVMFLLTLSVYFQTFSFLLWVCVVLIISVHF